MNDQPIGILDSGVGGLSIWREITSQLPHESTIYVADSKNCPYGSKSPSEVYRLTKRLVQLIIKQHVKLIVVACNTTTVYCIQELRKDFPNIPIVGTVPVVKMAKEQTKNKKIGVLSTKATAESSYQRDLIKKFAQGFEVTTVGSDVLVPLVEKGEIEGPSVEKVLKRELWPFIEKGVDTVALGCTHFPFLRNQIQKILGVRVLLLDSAPAIARQVRRILTNNNILSPSKKPSHAFYTTGDKKQFISVTKKLGVGDIIASVEEVDSDRVNWKNKKVAVLGLGIEGASNARFLKELGVDVTVLDQKDDKDYLKNIDQYDIIVRSPGIKRLLPEIVDAEKKRVVVTSQTKIFFDLCPCPIIGVTGTKGKGTTATLIYEMLKKEGIDAYLGGNIGKSPLDFLDTLTPQSMVVLEMSSFQLQDLTKSPHIGVVLMITSEHLDYHKDVYEYIDAKRNIIRFQTNTDFVIINKDYPASRESDSETAGKVYHVSREQEISQGAFVKDGTVWLRFQEKEKKVIDAKDILLPGRHNLENVCAAVMAAALCGVSLKNMISVLKTFKGLVHRLELVETVSGVRYYDDSFSTTPETAIAAIKAFDVPEILLLGGSSKGSDFTELGRVISESPNIKAIIGIGKEWPKIKKSITYQVSSITYIEGLRNIREIVRKAQEIAEEGDVVLLSPACASFDMFKNYKDRGDQFKEEVQKLKS